MTGRKDGGSVYPILPPLDVANGHGSAPGYPYVEHGMSLRDLFAIEALNGILANTADDRVYAPGEAEAARRGKVRAAWAYADLMLEARDA